MSSHRRHHTLCNLPGPSTQIKAHHSSCRGNWQVRAPVWLGQSLGWQAAAVHAWKDQLQMAVKISRHLLVCLLKQRSTCFLSEKRKFKDSVFGINSNFSHESTMLSKILFRRRKSKKYLLPWLQNVCHEDWKFTLQEYVHSIIYKHFGWCTLGLTLRRSKTERQTGGSWQLRLPGDITVTLKTGNYDTLTCTASVFPFGFLHKCWLFVSKFWSFTMSTF